AQDLFPAEAGIGTRAKDVPELTEEPLGQPLVVSEEAHDRVPDLSSPGAPGPGVPSEGVLPAGKPHYISQRGFALADLLEGGLDLSWESHRHHRRQRRQEPSRKQQGALVVDIEPVPNDIAENGALGHIVTDGDKAVVVPPLGVPPAHLIK